MSDPLQALVAVGGTQPTTTSSDFPPIPAVPQSDSPAVTNFLSSVKNWLEKATSSGMNGIVSKQYLIDIGVLKQMDDGSVAPAIPPSSSIPPVPTGVVANGAASVVIIEWNDPRSKYPNHSYTEIWAADSDNFTTASMIGHAAGSIYAHSVGSDSTRYYWIRFISTSDVAGPFSSISGAPGTTSLDPAYLIGLLSGTSGDQPFFTLTAPTVINGVTIPSGTYMKEAFIADAAISRAKIRDLAVDDAKIASLSAAKLLAGSVGVSEYIQSTGYSAGTSGFKIAGNGSAEFNNGVFRGDIYANGGYFNGIVSAASVEAALGSATYYKYETAGTYSLYIPSGLNFDTIRIRIIGGSGGGGGGGGGYNYYGYYNNGGSGGPGGSGTDVTYDVSYSSKAGTTISITVGAGGNGGVGGGGGGGAYTYPNGGGGGDGVNGSSSSVTGIGSASGGLGGHGGTGAYNAGGNFTDGFTIVAGSDGAASGNGIGGAAGAGGGGGWSYSMSEPGKGGGNGGNGNAGKVLITLFKGNTLVKETSYQNLITWLDTLGHGVVPSNAR